MLQIRKFGEAAEQSHMRRLLHSRMHLLIGQEASAVGTRIPLSDKEIGYCRGESMHIAEISKSNFNSGDRCQPRKKFESGCSRIRSRACPNFQNHTESSPNGVGWGRTLHATLDFMEGRPLRNTRVVFLLGEIAELFNSEGFLIPAPALVDSPETRKALLQRCGLGNVFRMAEFSDIALLSCGEISESTNRQPLCLWIAISAIFEPQDVRTTSTR